VALTFMRAAEQALHLTSAAWQDEAALAGEREC